MQAQDKVGSANGIRTRVTAVRGRCPRPLDDSAEVLLVNAKLPFRPVSTAIFAWSTGLEQATVLNLPTSEPPDQKRELRRIFGAQRFRQDHGFKFRDTLSRITFSRTFLLVPIVVE
jgi:hypothetical protein